MNPIKISVITPSYNQGQFIEETILSVLNQGYPNLEYIIIDGGSTDKTVEIIMKYEHQLKYWVSEKDGGQSEAINKGFKKATGDIICWINSDDILMPGALKKVAYYFTQNTDIDFINGQSVLIDKGSNIMSSLFILKPKKWYARRGVFYINQPAMFWRRRILDDTGYLREDLHTIMDKEFLIRVFKKNFKIAYTRKFLAAFRIHNVSKSSLGNTSEMYLKDCRELYSIYGSEYGHKPNFIYVLVYRLEKLLKGIYFRKWRFTYLWRGRNVSELNSNNCNYL